LIEKINITDSQFKSMRLFFYLLILPVSMMPTRILYGISDFMYVLIYLIFGYRRETVRKNLSNSFPEMNQEEYKALEKQFYAHLCDLIVESVKAFSISKSETQNRFVHRNPEIFQKFMQEGRNVTLVGGHYGNWELFAVSVGLDISHQPVALYTPLKNKFFNQKITKSRSRFGLEMKSYAEVKELATKKDQKPIVVIFGSDQCPKLSQQPHWMEFLNQETGVQFGTEKFARDYNTPVVYGVIHKIKRGFYEIEYRMICEHPELLPPGQITELHTKELEKDIRANPAYWLWTHKRWKRKKADFMKPEIVESPLM
jgi:Kdo2-lipid IVA lauroyltransferase/acyltransferase